MWYDSVVNKGAEPVRWILVVAIAYTLATTLWSFFETPTETVLTSPTPGPTERPPQRSPSEMDWILSKQLFGQAGQAADTQTRRNTPVVQTRLPLELQSVFVAEPAEASAAIVAQRGKPGKLYAIGDRLPGNATLIEVRTDQILLRRAGSRETLTFPKSKTQFVAEPVENSPNSRPPANSSAVVPKLSQSAGATARQLQAPIDNVKAAGPTRSEITAEIESTLQALTDQGETLTDQGGYRLGNLAQSAYLRQSGLQPGDVILSVNGQSIADLKDNRTEITNIMMQTSARIEVQRGSRRFFITTALNAQR